MAQTFSSLSPKQQASAQVQSKNVLKVANMNHHKKKLGTTVAANTATAEEQSFINPFSIASRKDSEHNSEGEVTAEGFYKGPSDSLADQSSKLGNQIRED